MLLYDRYELGSKREITPEGFLKVPGNISRTGIQNYTAAEMGLSDKEPDEVIRVYRPPEEVFSEASMSSFAMKPVTNNHPPVLVDSTNAKEFAVGMSGMDITKDGIHVVADLIITDAETIAQVKSGKSELSNGYTADVDFAPGLSPDGDEYDAIQRNIAGNHIAVVERGRAGANCCLADNSPDVGGTKMAKITVDGVDFEVSDQAAQAVQKVMTRLTDAEEKAEEQDEEMEKKKKEDEEKEEEAKKTADTAKAKLDDALSKVPSAEALDKLVTDRAAFVAKAAKICPDVKWEGKDTATIRKEVVADKCPDVVMDDVSEDYIQARFDMLSEASPVAPKGTIDEALAQQLKDKAEGVDNRPLDVIAREKMMSDSQDAWKPKAQD